MMAEYINKNELLKAMQTKHYNLLRNHGVWSEYAYGFDCAMAMVSCQPAADVVEVVRCKDCRITQSRLQPFGDAIAEWNGEADIDQQTAEIERLEIELQAMRGAANCYKAEVNRLETENLILSQKRANIFEVMEANERGRAQGIKEFAERLQEKYSQADILCPRRIVSLTEKDLDNLVKEMAGDDK